MPEKAAIVDLDQELWADYVQCRDQREVARRHGISQSSVSEAIGRYLATVPPEERAAYRARQLERYEALYQAHREQAQTKPRTAAIVRGILDSQCRLLGLVETRVQHQGQVDHAHGWTPGPSIAEVLDDWRRRGILRGELSRP